MSLNRRSVYFTLAERASKAFFEGEDRNRYFAWSTSPFYDLAFFDHAMQIPDERKKAYRLYTDFMQKLAPQLMIYEDARGGRIGNTRFIIQKMIQERFRSSHPLIKGSLRKIYIHAASRGQEAETSDLNIMSSALNCWDREVLAKVYAAASPDYRKHLQTLMKLFAVQS